MSENDVITGLTKGVFADRRRDVVRKVIGKEGDDANLKPLSEMRGEGRLEHAIVCTAAKDVKMSNDVFYPFHQNANFFYLTGLAEPDAVLVIETIPGCPFPQHKSILFVPEHEPEREMIDGLRLGSRGALNLTGVQETYPLSALPGHVAKYARMKVKLWGDLLPGQISNMELHASYLHDGIIAAAQSGVEIFALTPILHQKRLVKTEAEIDVIRTGSQIACEGLLDTMAASSSSESYLAALFEFGCRARGADSLFATPTIAAGSVRATLPHYDANYLDIQKGDLVVLAGSPRYSGYCSRVGRTWPVGPAAKFSEAQLAIYSIVLFVQNGIINLLKEKSVSLDELYGFMIISFSQKLFELGFFEGAKRDEILRWTQILSPQFVGHHIGLDLHDTLEIPTSTKLRPGMVINSMPGLYIPKDDRFPKEYHGIGVRLEDTITITRKGAECLTDLAPREVDQIEEIIALSAT